MLNIKVPLVCAFVVCLAFNLTRAAAAERQNVTFEITRAVGADEAVFVLGDLPELGGGDVRRAVRLADVGGDTWRVTVSLPRNRAYRYQYLVRVGERTALCDSANARTVGEVVEAETDSSAEASSFKQLVCRSAAALPILYWRTDRWPFLSLSLRNVGPGRSSGESNWVASGFARTGDTVEFYLSDETGTFRDPPTGFYTTKLDSFLIQDGHVFNYIPADSVGPHRRDYDPADPPTIESDVLEERRPYRVMLPRGYDDHPDRRYPVMYMHDGQYQFDDVVPPAPCTGSIMGALEDVVTRIVQTAHTREVIFVGIDTLYPSGTLPDECPQTLRLRDLYPPGDSWPGTVPRSDLYAAFMINELKPWIDSQYRTLVDRESTGSFGYSAGGTAALYLGWDFPEVFSRVGSFSGGTATTFVPNFMARLLSEPRRDIRIYMDSGDTAGSDPNETEIPIYEGNFAIRNNFIAKGPEPYVIDGDLRYFHDCGAEHTLFAMPPRFPGMLTFLFPATEEVNGLTSDCNANRVADADEISGNPTLDEDADGMLDACEPDCNSNGKPDDQDIEIGSSSDCNLNGRPDECEIDCNENGMPDDCDLASGAGSDCNGNGVLDECDVLVGKGGACDVWASEDVPRPANSANSIVDNQGGLRAADGCMLILGAEGDLVGRSDRFHYVHELQGGNFTLTARISDWQDAAEGAKLGLMIREDLGVGARTGTVLLERTEDGFQHLFFRRTILTRTFPHETYESPEVWLRIEKAGNDILGSLSIDGANWTDPDTITLSGLPRRIHVGVFSSYTADIPSVATVCDVSLQVEPIPIQFIRGDGNGDGSVNIADASCVANFLFGVAPATPPPCEAAADGNGDGRINIADASFIANFLFGIGIAAAPPAPYPDCGFPDGEPLSCDDPWGCAE